jgi:hypothetical protein
MTIGAQILESSRLAYPQRLHVARSGVGTEMPAQLNSSGNVQSHSQTAGFRLCLS